MEWIGIIVTFTMIFMLVYIILWCYDNNAKHEDMDREAFERGRQIRQQEFDRHAQEIAHVEIMEVCESIYIGRWQHD